MNPLCVLVSAVADQRNGVLRFGTPEEVEINWKIRNDSRVLNIIY